MRERYAQLTLPYVRGVAQGGGRRGDAACSPDFAHPFERAFSELLSFYGVRWSYEPTSFTLSWTEDGAPREMFTPDFYLPDQRLYIELTAMRQRLVTRKHRKLRRMRSLYPGVAVKLLYRRDYQRIARSCRPVAPATAVPGATLQTAHEIIARVGTLAEEIAGDFAAASAPLALGVGTGGTAILAAIQADLAMRSPSIAIETDRVAVTRFRADGGANRIHLTRRPQAEVRGRSVLLVVDIVSSGLTLAYLTAWLRRRGAARIDVCALLSRESARLFETTLTYVGFLAPHELVVGYGLSLFREHRGLTHIAALAAGDGPFVTPGGDPGYPPDVARRAAR